TAVSTWDTRGGEFERLARKNRGLSGGARLSTQMAMALLGTLHARFAGAAFMTTSQALLTDSSSAPVASDRRAHPRISGDLLLVQQARLKFGPSVAIVDLSAGGALLETAIPLRPGGASALELLAGERAAIVPFRVTRSYVVGLQGPVLYRGACAF